MNTSATSSQTVKKTTSTEGSTPEIKIRFKNFNAYYGSQQALHDINIRIPARQVTACIGASGCGKSTLLRCINRMNDPISAFLATGALRLDHLEINDPNLDVVALRQRVGMVFQKPNPFPKSIYDNVAYGPRIHGLCGSKADLDEVVEASLIKAGLWDQVKDRLNTSATRLSGGQQQRLCIARTIAISPEVILMDEPCSALDPIATATIEELMEELKENFTLVVVTHSMSQAQRISDRTAFFHMGHLIEKGPTKEIFSNPQKKRTQEYLSGAFG